MSGKGTEAWTRKTETGPRAWVGKTGVNENKMRKEAQKKKHTSQIA